MKHILTTLFFIGICLASFAQKEHEFLGKWVGELTQKEGGFRQKYYCEMVIERQGKQYFGTTYVSVEDLSAEMSFKAEFKGDVLVFKEDRIIRYSQLKDMVWCLKWGDLQLRKKGSSWFLEGKWNGQSVYGPCIPGKVFLHREVPRA
jgi:hypothetical protein